MEAVTVKYDIALSAEEAKNGTTKILTRNGRKLEVIIPPDKKEGSTIKLTSALQVTDGREGDILITIRVKKGNGGAAGVVSITDSSFDSEVLGSRLPVLVDFWAPWCGPCRMVGSVVEKMAHEFAGKMKFCKLNIDENPEISGHFQVMSIPTLLVFKDGQVADKLVGAQPEQVLRSRIDTVLQQH